MKNPFKTLFRKEPDYSPYTKEECEAAERLLQTIPANGFPYGKTKADKDEIYFLNY